MTDSRKSTRQIIGIGRNLTCMKLAAAGCLAYGVVHNTTSCLLPLLAKIRTSQSNLTRVIMLVLIRYSVKEILGDLRRFCSHCSSASEMKDELKMALSGRVHRLCLFQRCFPHAYSRSSLVFDLSYELIQRPWSQCHTL